ncbi:MAG: hypothetical protein M0Z82_09635 [Actinomycetota bacterium]|nr:hypothetical protein [Actinomycetota bacterium]
MEVASSVARGSRQFVPRASDALLSTTAIGGAAVLMTLDAWLARHFLPAQSAGLYPSTTSLTAAPPTSVLASWPSLTPARGSPASATS